MKKGARRERKRFLGKGEKKLGSEARVDSGGQEVDADVEDAGNLAAKFRRLVHPAQFFFE